MFGSSREKHTKTHSKSRRSARSTKVSRGTCEMLRGGLQDFSSPSTSLRASSQKKNDQQKQGNSIKKLHNWMVGTCLCNTTGTKTVQSLICTCGTSAVHCACQIVGACCCITTGTSSTRSGKAPMNLSMYCTCGISTVLGIF